MRLPSQSHRSETELMATIFGTAGETETRNAIETETENAIETRVGVDAKSVKRNGGKVSEASVTVRSRSLTVTPVMFEK